MRTTDEMVKATIVSNLGSLEIRGSTYISAKLKKRTYMYDSLQFPVEMKTRGSKTLTTFIPFHTKYVFRLLLHLLTLSGRFRFGFGVGDTSNFIELNL